VKLHKATFAPIQLMPYLISPLSSHLPQLYVGAEFSIPLSAAFHAEVLDATSASIVARYPRYSENEQFQIYEYTP
jgi:hypothetical protein